MDSSEVCQRMGDKRVKTGIADPYHLNDGESEWCVRIGQGFGGEIPATEKNEIIIEFLLRLEQKKEPETNKNTFKGIVEKEGKDRFLDRITENIRTAVREETHYFSIQHYDSQGNLIGQWPEENKLNLPL